MKIKTIFSNLRHFKWPLWIALCAFSLMSAIYQTLRTFLVSINTSTAGIDVIGQMEWYDLIDETLKAFLIVPLYSILNKIFINNKEEVPYFVFKSLLVVIVIYSIFNVGILIYGNAFISYMNPQENDIAAISSYLKLETMAFMIGIIPSFFNVVFVATLETKNVYIFLVIQVIFGIISDFLLVPSLGISGGSNKQYYYKFYFSNCGLCYFKFRKVNQIMPF